MNPGEIHLPYSVPTVLLGIAFGLKVPTFLRSWRDPDVRSTWLFLLWATAVFCSVAPGSIHAVNILTGVPNFAAPWTYSLLTAFCGSCLTMVITWRDAPSARRSRRIRQIWAVYTGIIIGLWITFALARTPSERIYDLDTYYANTPWMREHILLYLIAHMVSAFVAAYMIWTWIPTVHRGWLKASLVFLQAGYAFGLVFDVAKLLAIGARWTGNDWDWLSTDVAPPFALLDASLVGTGFILPVFGPFLQTWPRDQVTYWVLAPLARSIRRVAPSAAHVRVGRFAPLDLRLVQRRQHINDGLLRLAPYFDHGLYTRAYAAARTHHDDTKSRCLYARHGDTRARGIAGAVALGAALDAYRAGTPRTASGESAQVGTCVTDHLTAISGALYRRRSVDAIRQRVTRTESVNAHV